MIAAVLSLDNRDRGNVCLTVAGAGVALVSRKSTSAAARRFAPSPMLNFILPPRVGRTLRIATGRPASPWPGPHRWRQISLGLAGWMCLNLATGAPLTNSLPRDPDTDYIVDVWDADRGLPQSTVTSITQTPDGYLWLGTQLGGLARFDGVRFVTFDPANSVNLPSVEILKLLVDPQGTLWIGTAEGDVISRVKNHFHLEFADPHTPSSWLNTMVASRSNEVVLSSINGWLYYGANERGASHWLTLKPPDAYAGSSPVADRDGTVWYRRKNLRLGRLHGRTVELLASVPGLNDQNIYCLAKDEAGQIWVGTARDLAYWDGACFVSPPQINGRAFQDVRKIVAAPDGGIWIWAGQQLLKWGYQHWLATVDIARLNLLGTPRPAQLYPDDHGGIWLIQEKAGLWHVDANGTLTELGVGQGLPPDPVECWFQDREGDVWLGLNGGGLARIHQRAFHVAWPDRPAFARGANSVCEDARGRQWFGTSGNSFLRWADGRFDVWTPPPDNLAGVNTTVCPDAQGRLWVGTVQNGAWLFESNTLRRPFPSPSVGTVVRAFYQDHAGRMWIGNEFGLYCWDHDRLRAFTERDGFASAYILAITEDEAGTLWLGTANGELRSYQHGQFTSYYPADRFARGSRGATETNAQAEATAQGRLSGGQRFWAIHADRPGTLWIGTLGGGLLRFQAGQFTRYTTQEGLPNDNVSQILEDKRGRLWLGTRAGIACVARKDLDAFARGASATPTVITYGRADGLPGVECSSGYQPDCWAGADGRLWFTTAKGATWVNPRKLPFNPLPPPVQIEEFRVDKQLVAGGITGFGPSTPLRIPAGRHYLEFKFTALSLVSPDKVRFRWQLRGAERDWVDGGSERSVGYSYQPPGHYEFVVQACNNDGVWNETGARLNFYVEPYFWQTWWFLTLLALAAGVVLFVLYSIRIGHLRGLERLRLRIARDLHDDVGSNLGSIALLAQVMEKHPAAEDARQIRGIVSQTVDTLRDIVWFIDPQHERLSDLVARMAETAKAMLVDIPYTFNQSGQFASASLPLDFRRNIMPIFKETLHNIVRHSAATHVEIRVSRANGIFKFMVADNGRGFSLADRPPGNGLKNIRRRAAELKARLDLSSEPGGGTRLTLATNAP